MKDNTMFLLFIIGAGGFFLWRQSVQNTERSFLESVLGSKSAADDVMKG